MKKFRSYLVLGLLLGLLTTVVAAAEPSQASPDPEINPRLAMSDPDFLVSMPWGDMIREYESYHVYSFYSSMGCTRFDCTDPDHTHWCALKICSDPSHGHSEAEYKAAAGVSPLCPCHKKAEASPDPEINPALAMSDPDFLVSMPWGDMIREYESYHVYSFYSSMGCTRFDCTDPNHTHWCALKICSDPSHGHSEAEYKAAAGVSPLCPCHKKS